MPIDLKHELSSSAGFSKFTTKGETQSSKNYQRRCVHDDSDYDDGSSLLDGAVQQLLIYQTVNCKRDATCQSNRENSVHRSIPRSSDKRKSSEVFTSAQSEPGSDHTDDNAAAVAATAAAPPNNKKARCAPSTNTCIGVSARKCGGSRALQNRKSAEERE